MFFVYYFNVDAAPYSLRSKNNRPEGGNTETEISSGSQQPETKTGGTEKQIVRNSIVWLDSKMR